jgi:hypothetical protein
MREGLVAIRRPLGGNVGVREEQVFRMNGCRHVRHAHDGQRQLEQPLQHLGALDPDLLPRSALEGLAQARPVDLIHERVAGTGITSAVLSRSSEISSSAAGKPSCVRPVKMTGPPFVWKRSTRTPSSSRVKA